LALPTISVPVSLSVKEGSILTIPVTKTGSGACSVELVTAGSTAKTGLDYVGFDKPVAVSFEEYQKYASATVTILADTRFENRETFLVYVKTPTDCTIGQGKCIVNIEDDSPIVSLPTKITIEEGTELPVPVTKVGKGVCSVEVRTAGNTAQPGSDYVGYDTPVVVSFGETDTSATALLSVKADDVIEPVETVSLYLGGASGCTIRQGKCVVSIEDTTPVVVTDPDNGGDPGTDPIPDPDPMPDTTKPVYGRAIGFATAMPAGLGKPFYRVTNLNDSGPGSLRDAVDSGNRLVVFEVGGCIKLKSHLVLDHDNVTVAGQTAPGQGITVQVKEIQVKASNIRVEHITFERGHDASDVANADVAKISPGSNNSNWKRSNIHFSHCAFLWGTDETVEIWPSGGDLSSISFSDCIFAEPLWRPQKLGYKAHEKVASGLQSEHNYGVIIGYNTKRVDIQNSLFADMTMRTPFIDHGTSVCLANNILLNVRWGSTIQQNVSPSPSQACLVNAQGILAISGPQSGPHTPFRFHSYPDRWPSGSAVYVNNLYGWKGANSSITPGNSLFFTKGQPVQGSDNARVVVSAPPIQPPGTTIKALGAQQIFDRLVKNCGPTPKLAKRNPAVARIIGKLRAKTGGWVDHQSQVGGYSNYPSVSRKLEAVTLADGSKVAVPDASDTEAVQKWLDTFTSAVSYD
jgi:hypothetical protein